MTTHVSESEISVALDLDLSLAKVLSHLLDERIVTTEAVEARNALSPGSGRVYIGRLRSFLKENKSIALRMKKNVGYYLDSKDRDKIVKLVAAQFS